MRYSATGITELTPRGRAKVRYAVKQLPEVEELTSGAAFGTDTEFALSGIRYHPDALHRLVVPAAPHNQRLVEQFVGLSDQHNIAIEFGPVFVKYGEAYMARNDMLVAHCETLEAFPKTEHEVLRSGTWATVRRALKAEKVVVLHPLEDTDE
jgi:hypothetical protein